MASAASTPDMASAESTSDMASAESTPDMTSAESTLDMASAESTPDMAPPKKARTIEDLRDPSIVATGQRKLEVLYNEWANGYPVVLASPDGKSFNLFNGNAKNITFLRFSEDLAQEAEFAAHTPSEIDALKKVAELVAVLGLAFPGWPACPPVTALPDFEAVFIPMDSVGAVVTLM